MAKTVKILGLGGSLASVSRSRAALQAALEGAERAGAETELLDIRRLDLPMYNPDDDEPTDAAARLIEASYAADGLIWSSPMYQGTISGAFKNALDWLHLLGPGEPSYLHDRVIGLISAAGGTQGLQAIRRRGLIRRSERGSAPKPLTDEAVRAADVVITMGCGDACPIYPGKRYEDWELDDPAGRDLETVRRIRDELDGRVQKLIGELLPDGQRSAS